MLAYVARNICQKMNYQHFVTVFFGSVLLWHYYYSLIYFHLYCSFIWLLVIFWTHYFWMKHAYVRTKNHKHRQQFSFSSLVRLNEFSYHTIPFEWIIALNRIDRWSKNGKKWGEKRFVISLLNPHQDRYVIIICFENESAHAIIQIRSR